MRPGADLPRDLPDRIFRQSLRRPANLSDFLYLVVPQMADGFDCDRARLLDREFLTEDWRRREADLPFEVPYRTAEGEEPSLVCVLIEHQSDTDPLIPLRLLSYVVWYWDRQWQAWAGSDRPRSPLRLHPVLPIVLYSGARPWGSNRTLADLLGGPAVFRGFAPRWEPVFWNLADQTPAGLLNGGEWSQMLAAVQAADGDETVFEPTFPDAMRRLSGLADRDPVRWQELVWMALSYAWSRRPAQDRERLLEITRQANPARQRRGGQHGQDGDGRFDRPGGGERGVARASEHPATVPHRAVRRTPRRGAAADRPGDGPGTASHRHPAGFHHQVAGRAEALMRR